MSAGRKGEDVHVSRGSRWLALAWGAGLAAAGAAVAFVLAGGRWAAGGAVVGAVTGAFAPSLYGGLRERGTRHEGWLSRALPTQPVYLSSVSVLHGRELAHTALHRRLAAAGARDAPARDTVPAW